MSDDDQAAEDTEERERRWQNFFYRDGTPEIARTLLTRFVCETAPELERLFTDPQEREAAGSHMVQGLLFFARAAERRPAIVRAYEQVARTVPVERVALVLRLLAHAGDAATEAFLRGFAAEPRNESAEALVETLLARGIGGAPELEADARAPITGPHHLDYRWAEFMATGDTAKVAEIVAVLAWPDRSRAHLDALLAPRRGLRALFGGNSRAAAIMRALGPLGFRFDPHSHAIQNREDVDIMAIRGDDGRSDGARFKAFVEALPERPTNELAVWAVTKAAAMWSLCANAEEQAPVLAVCEAALAGARGSQRLALLEVLGRAYGQRGDLAAELRVWQQFHEQEPERAAITGRIAALREQLGGDQSGA